MPSRSNSSASQGGSSKRTLREKLSISNLCQKFSSGSLSRNNASSPNEELDIPELPGDNTHDTSANQVSFLRKMTSRASLKSLTAENTRRNSQIEPGTTPRLRPRASLASLNIGFGLQLSLTPTPPAKGDEEESSRARHRAQTLDTDSTVLQRRSGAPTIHPPETGFASPATSSLSRHDSANNESEEPAESPQPASSNYDSDGSQKTLRASSPPPPVSRRCNRPHCHCCAVDRVRRTSQLGPLVDEPHVHPLRRKRAVRFGHQPQPPPEGSYELEEPELGASNLAWSVGAELCGRAEREEARKVAADAQKVAAEAARREELEREYQVAKQVVAEHEAAMFGESSRRGESSCNGQC